MATLPPDPAARRAREDGQKARSPGDPDRARARERRHVQPLRRARRTSMATTGYETLKEFQKAEVMVAPSLQTEGKSLQRSQGVGMGMSERLVIALIRHDLRSRRRLRRAVRAADRATCSRGTRLLRDRAALDAARRRCSRAAEGIILSGGPASVHVDGAPAIDPAIYDAGVPRARHLLRRAARGAATRRRGAQRPAAASTAAPSSTGRPAACSSPACRRRSVWMSHGDAIVRGPRGSASRAHRRHPGGGDRGSRPRALRGAVPPRGRRTRERPGGPEAVPLRRVRAAVPTGRPST